MYLVNDFKAVSLNHYPTKHIYLAASLLGVFKNDLMNYITRPINKMQCLCNFLSAILCRFLWPHSG